MEESDSTVAAGNSRSDGRETPGCDHLNPFPGLRPFEEKDHCWFFGRSTQEQELLDRLDTQKIVTVVGGSGCGKSSLIRAGLLPRLKTWGIPSAGRNWLPIVFTPGKQLDLTNRLSPMHNLADAFIAQTGKGIFSAADLDLVIDTFDQPDGFRELVGLLEEKSGLADSAGAAKINYLFLIDQFEELFAERLRGSQEAHSFVARIVDSWRRPHSRLFIVLTMRSEHLHDCTAYREFPEVINASSYLVRRLSDSELLTAIEGPVQTFATLDAEWRNRDFATEIQVDGEFKRAMLKEVDALAHDPDHLPLFQHCLYWVWRIACARPHSGGLASISRADLLSAAQLAEQPSTPGEILTRCLDVRANAAFLNVAPLDRHKACSLIRVLGIKDSLQTYKRTPLRVADLHRLDIVHEEYVRIRDALNSPHAYLREMPSDEIDIYHEALIRKFVQFRKWVDDDYNRGNLLRSVIAELPEQNSSGTHGSAELISERTARAARAAGLLDPTLNPLATERHYDWSGNPLGLAGEDSWTVAFDRLRKVIRNSASHYENERQRQVNRRRLGIGAGSFAILLCVVLGVSLVFQAMMDRETRAFQAFAIGAAVLGGSSPNAPHGAKLAQIQSALVGANYFDSPDRFWVGMFAPLSGERRRERWLNARKLGESTLTNLLTAVIASPFILEPRRQSAATVSFDGSPSGQYGSSEVNVLHQAQGITCEVDGKPAVSIRAGAGPAPPGIVTLDFPATSTLRMNETCTVLLAGVPIGSGELVVSAFEIPWRRIDGNWSAVDIQQNGLKMTLPEESARLQSFVDGEVSFSAVGDTVGADNPEQVSFDYYALGMQPLLPETLDPGAFTPLKKLTRPDVICEPISKQFLASYGGTLKLKWFSLTRSTSDSPAMAGRRDNSRQRGQTSSDSRTASLCIAVLEQPWRDPYKKQFIQLYTGSADSAEEDRARQRIPFVSMLFTGPEIDGLSLGADGNPHEGWLRIEAGGASYSQPALLSALKRQASALLMAVKDRGPVTSEEAQSQDYWLPQYKLLAMSCSSPPELVAIHEQITATRDTRLTECADRSAGWRRWFPRMFQSAKVLE